MTGGVQTQQSVLDGHFMKRRSFLVAEERVWDPDFSPAVIAKTHLSRSAVVWIARSEDKSRVSPRLTKVHADRIVLKYTAGQSLSGQSLSSGSGQSPTPGTTSSAEYKGLTSDEP